MADLPYLPLFVDDYEAATAHLSIEEDGAYMRLLRLCWRTPGCIIPDDPQWIARRMRVDLGTFHRLVRPLLEEFFTLDGRRKEWTQKRLQSEHLRALEKSGKNRNASLTRWKRAKSADANAMQTQSECNAPIPIPIPREKRETNVSPKKSRGSRLPDGWSLPDEWRAWAESEGVPPQHIEDQAKRFADYWHGKAGQGATKADWFATWRNWIRNARGVPRVRAIDGGSHETEQQRAYREARERRAAIAERMDRERGGGA